MRGLGIATPGIGGLKVQVERLSLGFLLRRADFAPDAAFRELHNTQVHATHVQPFLPNWKRLDWIQVPDSVVGRAESWARDRDYQVNVSAGLGIELTHAEVLDAFLRYMARAEA